MGRGSAQGRGAEGRLSTRIMGHGDDLEVVTAQGRHVHLTIPAKAEYVAVCRLMIAALGQRSSLGAETVADLKVAVTEACSMLVVADDEATVSPPESAAIDLEIDLQDDEWIIQVTGVASAPAEASSASSAGELSDLGLTVIESLVDSVECGPHKGGRFFRMVKRLP